MTSGDPSTEGRTRDGPTEGATMNGSDDDTDGAGRAVVHGLVAVGLTVLAVVASVAGSVPGLFLGRNSAAGYAAALVGSELAFAVVGVGFLVVTGRGLGYLDLSVPGSHRTWGLVVGVTAGTLVFRSGALWLAFQAGIDPAASSVTNVDLPIDVLVAILLPAMLLVVGPAEELLFRGVLQKFLREVASAPVAILGAGLLFGVIHVLTFLQTTALGAVVSLVIITTVGLVFGWLYERTGSLPAAMLAHGGYNAVVVASAYVLHVMG